MNKTDTPKNPKRKRRRGISHRKKGKRNLELEDTGRHTVDKVSSGKNSITPKRLRNVNGKQERASNFKKMVILIFSDSILLRIANTTRLIKDVMLLYVCPKSSINILSPIITVENFELSIKKIIHHFMKNLKTRENFTFSSK